MKIRRTVITLACCGLCSLFAMAEPAQADLIELFYDDFDDGTIDEWIIWSPWGSSAWSAPDVVASPEGYALRGFGQGYGNDPGLHSRISTSMIAETTGPLLIEFRGKVGPGWPSNIGVRIGDDTNRYRLGVQGETHAESRDLSFSWNVYGSEGNFDDVYFLGDEAFNWHTYGVERDVAGNWSVLMDGEVVLSNFALEADPLLSFMYIELEVQRSEAYMEWVRISGIPTPGALALLELAGLVERRRRQA